MTPADTSDGPGPQPDGFLTRHHIADRERSYLAPYAAHEANSRGRQYDESRTEYRGVTRGLYQRDRDRIIHCGAFRRLEYKTQVFVNHEGDNYRTRLTHTLEVAQIARGIARALRLNEDLTEAVALAHDLGHTPFGHSGEDALRELMAEHGGFEHNHHGLQIVDRLERRYPDFPGLNLTYETRECIARHRTRHDHPTPAGFAPDKQSLLEGQVVDAADEIAYDNHDLEDGIRAGIITQEQLDRLELWQEATGRAEQAFDGLEADVRPPQIITFLIHILTIDLLAHSAEQIREAGVAGPDDVREHDRSLITFSPAIRAKKQQLEEFLFENVYHHYRVTRMATKAKRFLIELFHAYVDEPGQLPPSARAQIDEAMAAGASGDDALYRGVCDYIAGMTDRFALDEYRRLFVPFERV